MAPRRGDDRRWHRYGRFQHAGHGARFAVSGASPGLDKRDGWSGDYQPPHYTTRRHACRLSRERS